VTLAMSIVSTVSAKVGSSRWPMSAITGIPEKIRAPIAVFTSAYGRIAPASALPTPT
jgi:hypothetical protein